MRIHETALLVIVLCIAGWFRFLSATETEVEGPIRNDAREYVAYAYNLDTWGIYSKIPTWLEDHPAAPAPDAMRPPAYPEFLRIFLHGEPDEAFVAHVVIAQAMLGLLIVLIGYATTRLALGWRAALAVAVLLALCPQLVIYESYLLTETLFTFAVALAMLVGVMALQARSRRTLLIGAACFGVTIGLSALVRPTLQYMPPVLLIVALCVPALRRYRLPALLMVMGFALAFGPWTVRNIVTTGHASDPRLAIATLQGGSYPDFMFEGDPKTYGGPSEVDPRSAEISASTRTILMEIARKFRAQPLEYLRWYLIGKPIAFFSWDEVSGWGWVFIYPVLRSPFLHDPIVRATSALMLGLHWPLMICGVLGLVWPWLPAARAFPRGIAPLIPRFVAIVFGFVLLLHVVGTPLPRYGVPFRPLLYLLAVYFLMAFFENLGQRVQAARRAS